MLQVYALKKTVEAMGKTAEIIPYAPIKLVGRYWWLPVTAAFQNGRIRYRLRLRVFKGNLSFGRSFWRRRRAMARFRRQYLTKERPANRVDRLSLEKYDSILVGSDQVWNPMITAGLDDAYLGNFARREGARLISYAASFGRSFLPEPFCPKFAGHVSGRFTAVSVREKSAVPFAERLLKRPVPAVLDPVLLVERERWRSLARPPAERDYILIYWTEADEQLLRCARGIARQYGKPVIQVSYPIRKRLLKGVKPAIAGGPAEFLGFVQNAACVLTNSFHGTAFSVLFEKPFLTFPHSTLNDRLADLLELLELSPRLRDRHTPVAAPEIWEPIDWARVNRRLEAERLRSRSFLQGSLEGGEGA